MGGMSAMAMAALKGHHSIVKGLYEHVLEKKTEQEVAEFVNFGDKNGATPLHWARKNGYEEVAKYLVDTVKVDMLRLDNQNRSALDYARGEGHETIASWLSKL